jgi:hypothetical protein
MTSPTSSPVVYRCERCDNMISYGQTCEECTPYSPVASPNVIGSACPLLASAPIDKIVKQRDVLDRNAYIIRYADGQTLEIRTRPDTSPERVRAIAQGY